ncbi:RNA polymerase subunit sigma-24 [Pseudomonas sp. A46]|jgi:RNA polymerase sigma-70 factor (ECF subfamily)|uniref:RNA polymerase sigma factor n=1 Tax=Metapseudomonas furukawaii TaxID=1149133 RepID=UPI000B4A04E2|nr:MULTISPECIES: sigma-70 family RNA polymerase sigma factor [Pseudomonas]OWJ95818.1 RNA polymerase subunit sigma-24 [Pseudomonas sp. A46]WAG79294.1 sigma-70 family RNA polymerase sigma factor [Pseudomonas furukawaii]
MTDSSSPAAPAPDASASADPDRREDFLRTFLSRRQQMETLVSRRVGCRATAADLVQDLFLRFWRRPTAPVEDLGTYLLRSAHNLAIDHLRSEGSRNRAESALLPEQQLAEPASPEAALEAGSQLRHVESALRELPERTRQIFLLNRIHGRTYGEIARAMGLTQSAVEKHMMRALEVCKTSLHRADQPSPRPGSAPDES